MKDNVVLVLQSYGSEHEYRRAILSIWSFYAHASAEHQSTNVFLFTDEPHFFKEYFRDLPVTYFRLTPEKIQTMKGGLHFLHRIKICVIEEAFRCSEGNVLYIDSDTFFTKNPDFLFSKLSGKVSFMHTNEYAFSSLSEMPLPSGERAHAVLKVIEEIEFRMANGSQQKFMSSLFSWNAGVVMLHRARQHLLADVHAVTEQLFSKTTNHASEQYAFSMVLQTSTEVYGCESIIYHYWYRIKKQIADRFLSAQLNSGWVSLNIQQKKMIIRQWTNILPEYFDSHVFMLRDNSIQAFNEDKFEKAYRWAVKAIIRNPFDVTFMKDTLPESLLNRKSGFFVKKVSESI